jgi:phospholipase C
MYFNILRRTQGTTDINGGLSGNPEFIVITNVFGFLEQKRPTTRFNGVTISDAITHIAYTRFDSNIYELDTNSLFIEKVGQPRSRYYKLSSIANHGERDEWLALYLEEKGFSDLSAAGV